MGGLGRDDGPSAPHPKRYCPRISSEYPGAANSTGQRPGVLAHDSALTATNTYQLLSFEPGGVRSTGRKCRHSTCAGVCVYGLPTVRVYQHGLVSAVSLHFHHTSSACRHFGEVKVLFSFVLNWF